jgi:hypothetical protein
MTGYRNISVAGEPVAGAPAFDAAAPSRLSAARSLIPTAAAPVVGGAPGPGPLALLPATGEVVFTIGANYLVFGKPLAAGGYGWRRGPDCNVSGAAVPADGAGAGAGVGAGLGMVAPPCGAYLRGKTANNNLVELESYWPRWPQPSYAPKVYGPGNAFIIVKHTSRDGEQWSAPRRVKNITKASVAAAVCTGLAGASLAKCVAAVSPLPVVDVGPSSGGMVEAPDGTLLWFITFSAQIKHTVFADRQWDVPVNATLSGVNTVVRSTDSGETGSGRHRHSTLSLALLQRIHGRWMTSHDSGAPAQARRGATPSTSTARTHASPTSATSRRRRRTSTRSTSASGSAPSRASSRRASTPTRKTSTSLGRRPARTAVGAGRRSRAGPSSWRRRRQSRRPRGS